MREIDDIPFGEGPVESAPEKQSPPPEKQSPSPDPIEPQSPPPESQSSPPEKQSAPPAPKRKRTPRPEPEVEEETTRPTTRKERMKEKVDCDHCGKQITRHAQLYTHAKNCKGQQQQEYEPTSPRHPRQDTLASYVEPAQQSPDEDIMERLCICNVS